MKESKLRIKNEERKGSNGRLGNSKHCKQRRNLRTRQGEKVRGERKEKVDGCSKLIRLTKARNGIETRDRISEHSIDNKRRIKPEAKKDKKKKIKHWRMEVTSSPKTKTKNQMGLGAVRALMFSFLEFLNV